MYKFSQFVLFNRVLFSLETSASCVPSTTLSGVPGSTTTLCGVSGAATTLCGVSGVATTLSGVPGAATT